MWENVSQIDGAAAVLVDGALDLVAAVAVPQAKPVGKAHGAISSQSSSGISPASVLDQAVDLRWLDAAGERRGDARLAHRELQRRGGERDVVALAGGACRCVDARERSPSPASR